ncbi:HAD family hydrolase [Arthrobacter sp. Z1-15]
MRLVASDLDGTIVGPDNRISDRTVRAFRNCVEAGIDVVFVTGRPPRWLSPLQEFFGHQGTVICSNGAITYDLGAERVLKAQAVSLPAILDAAGIIRELYPRARFAAETVDGFHLGPGFLEPGSAELPGAVTPAPLESTLTDADTVVKFLARVDGATPDEFLHRVRPAVAHLVSTTHSAPSAALLEMSMLGLDKSVNLSDYAASRDIDPADVVAFGDMPNDVQMLQWAGCGYAMASGHADALAAADKVAPAFADDGVARVLEALLRRA